MRALERLGSTILWTAPLLGLAVLYAHPALASTGIPQVHYGTAPAGTGGIVTAIQNFAAFFRNILGATALLALVIGALVGHFVHLGPRAKETQREIVIAAIVGLLVAAFAPAIINAITGLNIPTF